MNLKEDIKELKKRVKILEKELEVPKRDEYIEEVKCISCGDIVETFKYTKQDAEFSGCTGFYDDIWDCKQLKHFIRVFDGSTRDSDIGSDDEHIVICYDCIKDKKLLDIVKKFDFDREWNGVLK
jgi:hypothetical protein